MFMQHHADEVAGYESQASGDKYLHLNHREISELSPTMSLLPFGEG